MWHSLTPEAMASSRAPRFATSPGSAVAVIAGYAFLERCFLAVAAVGSAGCSGQPSTYAPSSQLTIASPVRPGPTPCERAADLVDGARAAVREGRILRAKRRIDNALAICPAGAPGAHSLGAEIAISLGDQPGAEQGRPPVLPVGPSAHLDVAGQGEALFGPDVHGLTASTDEAGDYHKAARAFVDARYEAAEQGALRVALVGGELYSDAFVLAGRAAEAQHDRARSNRMYARAFHVSCSKPCDRTAKPPGEGLFAYASVWDGFRSRAAGCVSQAYGGNGREALTPDGSVLATAVSSRREVVLHSVPTRVFLGRVSLDPGAVACFSDSARFMFRYRPAGNGGTQSLELGPTGGAMLAVVGPNLDDPGRLSGIMASDGTAFVRDESRTTDGTLSLHWYRATSSELVLKRIPFRNDAISLRLSDGDFVGFDGSAGQTSTLFRYDSRSGKRLGVIAKAARGEGIVVSSDGQNAIFASSDHLIVVDVPGKTGKQHELDVVELGYPVGTVGSSRAIFKRSQDAVSRAMNLVTGDARKSAR